MTPLGVGLILSVSFGLCCWGVQMVFGGRHTEGKHILEMEC